MSRNTNKIEKALAAKGIAVKVTWTPMQGEDGDGGIDGYYSEELQNMKLFVKPFGREISHSGWLGYSLAEALLLISDIGE